MRGKPRLGSSLDFIRLKINYPNNVHGRGTRKKAIARPMGLLPEELLSTLTASLANMDGEEQAARQLGLAAAEVAADREHARRRPLRGDLRPRRARGGPGARGDWGLP